MRLIARGLKAVGLAAGNLKAAAKGDPRKIAIAELIQAENTMRLDWISGELGMGTRSWCCQQICQTRISLGKDRKLRKRRNAIKND